jgi:hypothetical protein
MKKFVFLCILLCIEFNVSAQKTASIIGRWQVVSYFDGEIYFNLQTDSSSISKEMLYSYPEKKAQEKLIENAKQIYSGFEYEFKKNGVYKQKLGIFDSSEGIYKLNPSKGTVDLFFDDSKQTCKYSFKNGLLEFTILFDDLKIEFTLKRFE